MNLSISRNSTLITLSPEKVILFSIFREKLIRIPVICFRSTVPPVVKVTIKSEFVIDCLEEWIEEKTETPSVLVLDNTRIHRSQKVQEKLPEREDKGFYIFNLRKPPRCFSSPN